MNAACANCLFFRPRNGVPECHRNPPKHAEPMWPIVSDANWCGAWKPRESAGPSGEKVLRVAEVLLGGMAASAPRIACGDTSVVESVALAKKLIAECEKVPDDGAT